MNPLTPVLVGVSQILERGFDPDAVREPIDLMLTAAKAAAAAAGGGQRRGSVVKSESRVDGHDVVGHLSRAAH